MAPAGTTTSRASATTSGTGSVLLVGALIPSSDARRLSPRSARPRTPAAGRLPASRVLRMPAMALALTHPSSDRPALRASANVLYGAAVLLALALPFEATRPLVSLGWAECTNLELLVGLTAVVWAGHTALLLLDTRGAALALRPLLSLPLVPPVLLFLMVALLSALLAPAHRPEALKFTFRLATGLYVLLLVVHVSTSLPRLTGLLWAIAFGAGGSALLGLGEAARWPMLESSLALFKAAPTHVGGELR